MLRNRHLTLKDSNFQQRTHSTTATIDSISSQKRLFHAWVTRLFYFLHKFFFRFAFAVRTIKDDEMENVIRHCNWKLNLKLVYFSWFLFSALSSLGPRHICHSLFSIVWLLGFLSAIVLFHHHFSLSITTIFVFVVVLFVIDILDCETDSHTCRVKWTFFLSIQCTHSTH